jgi:formamidopyrimidine-DNA glycosylase
LWRAEIDPLRPPAAVNADERKLLHRTIRDTLRQLSKRGGSHTGDMPREPGALCPRDSAPLLRRTIGGRTTFSCSQHQR